MDLLHQMSIALEYGLDPGQPDQQGRVATLRAALAWSHPPDEYFTKLDRLGSELAPSDRNRFQKLMERVRLYIDRIAAFAGPARLGDDLNWRVHELQLAKI